MRSYKSYVLKARKIIEQVECYQSKIASIALDACKGKRTISGFAKDIGVPCRTLQGWVQVYRDVIETLGIENPTPEDWSTAYKVNEYLKKEKGQTSAKGNLPRRKVIQLFKKIKDPESNQFLALERAIRNAKHVRHTVRSLDLSKASRESLKVLMYSLNESSVHINDFLISEKSAS